MAPRLCLTLAPLLFLAISAEASADVTTSLATRAGLSNPVGTGFRAGPSLGLEASLGFTPRYRFVLAADGSRHAWSADPSYKIEALTAAAGLEVKIDSLPVVPLASAGPAFQYARWVDATSLRTSTFTLYLELGVDAAVAWGLRAGVRARYLGSSFSATGFPAFSSYLITLGWSNEEP